MVTTQRSGKTGATISSRRKGATSRSGGACPALTAVEPATVDEAPVQVALRRPSAGPAKAARLVKRYLKTSPVCRVSFRLPAEVAPGECSVHVTGDFNGWEIDATPMIRLRNGDYSVTVDLETGREYRFRYLIDG